MSDDTFFVRRTAERLLARAIEDHDRPEHLQLYPDDERWDLVRGALQAVRLLEREVEVVS
jgi:hypothetical protein